MKLNKRKTVIFLFFAAIAAGIAYLIGGLYSEPMFEKKVTVGVFSNPPFVIKKENPLRFKGFDIEILQFIARDQELELKFKEVPFENIIDEILAGNIDTAAAISLIPEREKNVRFSWPLMETGLTAAVKTGNNSIKNLRDLNGKTIGTVSGVCEDFCGKVKPKKLVLFKSLPEMYMKLREGELDVVINDHAINRYYQKQLAGAIENIDVFYTYDYLGFPIRKENDALRHRINKGLKKLFSSGKYSEIYRKYFK